MAEEPQQITKEPQGKATASAANYKRTTTSNYKEP